MYDNHQPMVESFARANAEGFRDVYRFVLLTIRTPLVRAAESMRDADPSDMTGERQAAWQWIGDHAERVLGQCEDLLSGWHDPAECDAQLVAYLATLPGLGLAKAGFVAQLAFGRTGCLDTHNLRRFGYGAYAFAHLKRRKPAGQLALARKYVAAVAQCGGTGPLWDTWCQYVAERQPARYESAWQVSELHAWAFHLTE
jgi:hypothetical protein